MARPTLLQLEDRINPVSVISIAGVSAFEGNAGPTAFTFTVSLDIPDAADITLDFATADGTAIAGGDPATGGQDYVAVPLTKLTIPAGDTSATITVLVNGDSVVEAAEKFAVILSNPSVNATFVGGNDSAFGTILNDDTTTITITNPPPTLENAGPVTFIVTSSAAVQDGFKLDFTTVDGTALAGLDYVTQAGTLVFTGVAGEALPVTVTLVDDLVVEPPETFGLQVGPAGPAAVAGSILLPAVNGTATILNDDKTTLTITNVDQAENAGPAVFFVTSSAAVQGGFSVNYTLNAIAPTTPGADFDATPGTITFTGVAGEVVAISVGIVNDDIVEPDESFQVLLAGAAPPDIAPFVVLPGPATGIIRNDDTATLSVASVSGFEATGKLTFTVSVDKAVQGGFKLDFTTVDGTALAGLDYVTQAGTLVFTGVAGESKTVSVTILDENLVELDETFSFVLGPVTPTDAGIPAAKIVLPAPAIGTILNDDTAVLSIAPAPAVVEGNKLAFVLSLSNPVDTAVTVKVSTADGSAVAPADYLALAGLLVTFPATVQNQIVNVTTIDDRRVEGTETLTLVPANLAAAGRAVTLDATPAAGVILDNDTATLTFEAAAFALFEDNITFSKNVVLTLNTIGAGPIGLDRSITVSLTPTGTATLGPPVLGDYLLNTNAVTFTPGNFVTDKRPVSVTVFEDLTDEPDETIILTAAVTTDGTGGQAAIGVPGKLTITILNDDAGARNYDATVPGNYRLVRNGNFLDLLLDSGSGEVLIARDTAVGAAGNARVRLNGTVGTDWLQVDFAGDSATGGVVPLNGIEFNGNAGVDQLTFTGGSFSRITSRSVTGASGGVEYVAAALPGSKFVDYTGLESPLILAPLSVERQEFFLPAAAASQAVLEDDGVAGNKFARLKSVTGTFLETKFVAPTPTPPAALVVARGTATDTLTLNALPDVRSSISTGTAPFATVTIAGPVTSDGSVSLVGVTVAITAPLQAAFEVELIATTATQTAAIKSNTLRLGQAGNAGTYTLTNPANDTVNLVATTTGSVSFTDATGVNVAGANVGGNLTLAAGGSLTDSAPLVVAGITTVTTPADISFDTPTNDFATFAVPGAKNVRVVDATGLNLGGIAATGGMFLTVGGPITQTAKVVVAGGTTLEAGTADITLADPANDFSAIQILSGKAVRLVDVNAVTVAGAAVSGLDLTAGTGVTIAGNIAATAGVLMTANADVTVNSGVTVAAAAGATIRFGQAGAATFDSRGANFVAPNTTVTGGAGADTFRVTGTTTPVTLDGGPATDTLEFFALGLPVLAGPDSFNTAGAAVRYENIETVTLLNAGPLTIFGTNLADRLTLRTAPAGGLQYQFDGRGPVAAAGAPSVRFNGLDGDDVLVVDFANGSPIPAGGVLFDGGNGVDNLCVIAAGNTALFTTNPAGPGLAGSINLDGKTIGFENLEPTSQVDMTNLAALTVTFGTASDVLTVADGFDVRAGGVNPAIVISGPTTPRVATWNTTTLTLDTRTVDGADAITVTGANGPHNVTNLAIHTGAGGDAVNVVGSVTVAGNFTLETETASFSAIGLSAAKVTVANTKTLTFSGTNVQSGSEFTQASGGPVELAGGTTTTIVSNQTTRFSGPVNGPGSLTVNTTAPTVFDAPLGATIAVQQLRLNLSGLTAINGGLVKTSVAQEYTDDVIFSQSGTQFLGTGGVITFGASLAPTAPGFDLTTGGPGVNLTFNGPVSPIGTHTIPNAATVVVNAAITANRFEQLAGSGTTQFNAPVTLSANTPVTNYVTGGALNLATQTVVLNADITAPAGGVVLQLPAGVTQLAGRLATTAVYLTGAGLFQLDQPGNVLDNGGAGEVFADLSGSEIRIWDSTALVIAFDDPARPAIRIPLNGIVTLTTNSNFTAVDPRATTVATEVLTPLLSLPGGTVQVYFGVGLPATDPTLVRMIAEAVATRVILGTEDTTDPRANRARDRIEARPMIGAVLVVNGNTPTLADAGLAPFDTLVPQFVGIANANLVSQGVGAGTYTFPGTAFLALIYTSIETLGGLSAQAFVVQTAPRAGTLTAPETEYAVRLALAQSGAGGTAAIGTRLRGSGAVTNPFVVTPVLGSATAPFGSPQVALADIDGDGQLDLILANGAGDAPLVTVIRGSRLLAGELDLARLTPDDLLAQFFPFEPTYRGGLSLAVADFDGGGSEIVIGAGVGGGPRVSVFKLNNAVGNPPFGNVTRIADFFAYEESQRGGVNVAAADITGDGLPEIITGAGFGGGPRVRAFRDVLGNPDPSVVSDFFAYDENFRGGVLVAAGQFDDDGIADVVTAPGPGGGPRIRVFAGSAVAPLTRQVVADFFAFPPPSGLIEGQSGLAGFQTGVGAITFGASRDGRGLLQSLLVTSPRGRAFNIVEFALTVTDPTQANQNVQIDIGQGPIIVTTEGVALPFDLLRDGGSAGGTALVS